MSLAHRTTESLAGFVRTPRARRIGWWILGVILAIGVVGFLVVPPIAKHYLVEALSKELKREVTIESLRFNPYTLAVTVRGFVMKDRAGPEPALTFDELYVNASLGSIFRLAPVLDQIRLTKPHLRIVRNADKTYNFQDLIDEAMSKPKSEGPPPRVALYNIELVDGRVDFDDRPERNQHSVTDLQVGIPFISTIPGHAEINVQPLFAAKVNGAPLELTGESKPFKDTHETTLKVELDALQLPKYFDYSPVPLKFKLPSGQLDTRVTLAFKTAQEKPQALTVSGDVALTKIVVQDLAGAPVLGLPALRVSIGSLDAIARKGDVKSVAIEGVEVHLARLKNGDINLLKLVPELPPSEAKPATTPANPFVFTVGDIKLSDGRVHVRDEVPAKHYEVTLLNIAAAVQGLSNAPGAKAAVKLGFDTDAKGQFAYDGTVQLAPIRADGKVDFTGFRLGALYPYYEDVLNLEVADGTLDVATRFEAALDGDRLDARASELAATIKSLRLHFPGDKEPLWRIPLAEVKDGSADLAKRSIVLGEVATHDGIGNIDREADGRLNFARLLKVAPAAGTSGAKGGGDEWQVLVKRLRIERSTVNFRDLSTPSPVKVQVTGLDIAGEDLGTAKGVKGKASIRGTVNKTGRIAVAGPLTTNPVAGRMNVDVRTMDLTPFQPYVDQALNLGINAGAVSAKGVLDFDLPQGAQPKLGYAGEVNVTDFAAVDKPASQDLLKWKSLYVGGIKSTLEPLQVAVGEIALSEFYSRLIVNPDGTFNLQGLAKKPGAPVEAAKPAAGQPGEKAAAEKPAEKPPAENPAAGTEAKIAEAAKAAAMPANISVGKITLQGGNINFSDFFVRPNYTANLTGVGGSVTAITPETPGEVELRGKVDNAAPLEITGRINPLARDLFLDIKAAATDIELPPLSPYSVKYAGYGIERGKLSVKVKYLVENRKLTAENNVYLDQLTFGEKVDSPTATKMPVLLAVALLKDRNGVIDINLPVGGSLDDPQFSVGGIIIQVIVNLIVKAVTAPFALIGAMFGGGGEDLAYLEFEPGSARLDASDETKLKSIAKALTERPGLKLDVAGRVDPAADREGLKRAAVENQVKAQKVKETGKGATVSLDEIKVEPGEYPKYLTAAYKDASFPKPRNVIGIARDLPVPEMEQLMLANVQATDEDLRQLANRRAQVAKDWLVGKGSIPAERVFLVAPKLDAEGIKDKGKPERVDFSLK